MTREQIEARIAELKVENEKAPGGAGTNARAELIRELEAQLPCSAGSDERKTITVPPGYETVRDAEGRATGEVRKIPDAAQAAVATDGHVLMPYEPSQQIIDRMTASIDLADIPTPDDPPDRDYDYDMRKAYRAALSLASQPSPAATVETAAIVMRHGETMDEWHDRVGAPFPIPPCSAATERETALEAAALDFIAKVDRGEARSKHSYAAFKAALALTRPQSRSGK